MPNQFAMTPEGTLMIVSGFDPVLRWNGLTTQAEPAGIAVPTATPALAFSGSGTISGDYYAYVRFKDADGLVSNLSPVSALATATNALTVTYTNVEVPTSQRVTKKQILRNTAGQAETFYVDVETTDLGATTFTSTRTDSDLSTQEAVPLLNTDLSVFANRHTVPPDHKTSIAHHMGRMFMAGEMEYAEGNVQVTFGSTTVQGVGTEWTSSVAGRRLYIVGSDLSYLISSVDVVAQTLTLESAYQGTTDLFAPYAIRSAPAERRLIYFSVAGLEESWPATNAISVQEDGDEIVGLMPKASFMFILEKRHVYRFTMESDPLVDGAIFLAAERGCINNRCWVLIDDVAYMLDEFGVHRFGGGFDSEALSIPIQDLFERNSRSPYKINWKSQKFFHAVLYAEQEAIRWFVSLSGDYLPRHALCLNYRSGAWWIEEFAVPIGCSCVGVLDERPTVFLGTEAKRVLAFDIGTLDGANADQGTVRGTATSAGLTWIADTAATFAASGLVGSPIVVVDGKGKGQTRVIVSVSGTTININQPWSVLPDTTSVYQIGGIPWRYRTGQFRFVGDDVEEPRRIEVLWEPTTRTSTMDLRVYYDQSDIPVTWQHAYTSAAHAGVRVTKGSANLVVDLTKSNGFAQQRLDRHRETNLDGPRFVSIELAGVTNQDAVEVQQIGLEGVT